MNNQLNSEMVRNHDVYPWYVLKIPRDLWPVIISICIVAFVGIIPKSILSLGMLLLTLWMGLNGNIYLMYPICIFYYTYLGSVFGISFFRTYNLLFLAFTFLQKQGRIGIGMLSMAAVFVFYSVIVMFPYNQTQAVFYVIIVINLILLRYSYLDNNARIRKFWYVFVIAALLSFLSGLINHNVMVDTNQVVNSELVTFSRYMGLFNDPNYMGLFFSIAVFAIVTMKMFDKKIRIILIAALYAMLAATLSMTAILGNLLFWGIYLVTQGKIRPKVLIYCFLFACALVFLYFYALQHRDLPVLGAFAFRISGKLSGLAGGDMNYVTTGRTMLSAAHWKYYISQPISKILFGGNLVNSFVIDLPIGRFAAHNEYVDLLLNVGIVGASVIWGTVVWELFRCLRMRRYEENGEATFSFMMKVILMYYAATLTMFLEPRFMMLFFI